VPRWPCDLYVITAPGGPRELRPFVEALDAWPERPRLAIQVRDKAGPPERVEATLAALLPRARARGAPVLLNASTTDDLELARRAGVDGAHLTERAPAVADARAILGGERWIGASVHDEVGARRRAAEGADFLVAGPLGEVPGKGTPLGAAGLGRLVAAAVGIPVLALGGVRTREDVRVALEAGCAGIAVQSALLRSADGARTVREFGDWLDACARGPRFADLRRRSR
jgi:thiamine-phosphate diphosphorylase